MTGLPKQREIDLQTREKHQEQFSEFCQKICNRPDFAEDVENIGSYENTAEQQPYSWRNTHSTGKAGDHDEHHHPDRELRERRHGEKVLPERVEHLRRSRPCPRAISAIRLNQLNIWRRSWDWALGAIGCDAGMKLVQSSRQKLCTIGT